jgi:16S rRNA (guanine527-N7)-methyltransferase
VAGPSFDDRLAELIGSSPHGLVSARERSRVAMHHVAEARQLAEWLAGAEGSWMDLGTGGGLPGLVLASELREAEWTLVDSTGKKVEEVRRFAAELGVECWVVAARAEELAWDPAYRERFRGVVARAVAPLRTLAELGRGFLGPGGRLVAVKGRRAEAELEEAVTALERPSLRPGRIERLGGGETRVVELVAVGGAPEGVPRRTGVPQRRPW